MIDVNILTTGRVLSIDLNIPKKNISQNPSPKNIAAENMIDATILTTGRAICPRPVAPSIGGTSST